MERETGIWVLTAGAALFAVAVFVIRPRVAGGVADALVALCGAVLGAGALMVQTQVGAAEWITTIPVTAGLAVANIRAMFAGTGPLRT